MGRHLGSIAAAILVVSAATACSDPAEGQLGGDRIQVKVATEQYAVTDTEIEGRVNFQDNGCWTIDIGDGERLLALPEGFDRDETGLKMVSADGVWEISDGDQLGFVGGPLMANSFPGVPDGYWGNQLTFCRPQIAEFVSVDIIVSVTK